VVIRSNNSEPIFYIDEDYFTIQKAKGGDRVLRRFKIEKAKINRV
jgi:hypothetical protein